VSVEANLARISGRRAESGQFTSKIRLLPESRSRHATWRRDFSGEIRTAWRSCAAGAVYGNSTVRTCTANTAGTIVRQMTAGDHPDPASSPIDRTNALTGSMTSKRRADSGDDEPGGIWTATNAKGHHSLR
jgi:hypothetical protein